MHPGIQATCQERIAWQLRAEQQAAEIERLVGVLTIALARLDGHEDERCNDDIRKVIAARQQEGQT